MIGLLLTCILLSCQDDESENDAIQLFGCTDTSLTFSNEAGTKSVEVTGTTGNLTVTTVGGLSDWFTVNTTKEKEKTILSVTVAENIKVKSRRATIELTNGTQKRSLFILQTPKYFDTVAAVKELKAESAPGTVILTWEEPREDNYHHIVISAYDAQKNLIHSQRLEKGITTYTVHDLLSSAGEYLFQLQSFDEENEEGEISEIRCAAQKNISFKFKQIPPVSYIGYYFKAGNEVVSSFSIGSSEFNEGEKVTAGLGTRESLIREFNSVNEMKLTLMPEDAYILDDFVYDGTQDFQEMKLTINTVKLQDRTTYAIPLEIISVSGYSIDETGSTALLIFRVDDFEGWYTVERLPKCGESAGSYPAGKRRYIKRTGAYTWETGYLFRSYADSENTTEPADKIQFITLDPDTKKIHIQQGAYGTGEDLNEFDPATNELHIEYLYTEWANWWTHERMFNRSWQK